MCVCVRAHAYIHTYKHTHSHKFLLDDVVFSLDAVNIENVFFFPCQEPLLRATYTKSALFVPIPVSLCRKMLLRNS